tara:strand:- start:5091 stop:5939 length:849 start_codon:yes stop_codon:yes gene_type:complete
MTDKIIDGKLLQGKILEGLKKKISKLKDKPGIALVMVGEDAASQIYVNSKEKNCKKVGIYCERHNLPKNTKDMELLRLIDDLNQNQKIHGILVQMPLPKHIEEKLIVDAILPHKDVDGFTPVSLGNMMEGNPLIEPATPRGIMELIDSTKIDLKGKHVVVIGRSNIVGKPVALMLLARDATVTVCHSKTKNLGEITKTADVLVVACGKANMIKGDMVKEGAVVIDVGINRVNGKVVGDVDFDSVKDVAGFITPVPGGVGPMTIAMMLDNLLKAKELGDKYSV